MKKIDFKKWKLTTPSLSDINDRLLLINLYATQLVVLIIGAIMLLFMKPNLNAMFSLQLGWKIVLWGIGCAVAVLVMDFVVSRFAPKDVLDDGGMNKRLFGNRSLWHIAVISIIVAFCEEVLFRGAIGGLIGPYWTSILFALIHVRYLKHWLMTGMVFCISYGLGWMYAYTGTLWTPILAHFFIDFISGCIIRYSKEDK
ncbi:CPBP family intramembrane metalloprotease [Paenibacillus sp. N1-5-1-14]|uniref:CPBP family intramembrane glutamic endopeptidase n=1 Tax=Paenibacillus radicibacter TaxID=2972488 RepID=UPI002159532B|nr:type II CAAX endopeptidase family protein [Paenibacillus radicibacter]MCR8642328.1 CPBP family intramembrane metalloprotease [Paenibacillus radicibacter]